MNLIIVGLRKATKRPILQKMFSTGVAYLLAAIIAGCFAGLAAFLVTYGEYSRHFQEKKRVTKLALEAAFVAFLFFTLLAGLALLALTRLIL